MPIKVQTEVLRRLHSFRSKNGVLSVNSMRYKMPVRIRKYWHLQKYLSSFVMAHHVSCCWLSFIKTPTSLRTVADRYMVSVSCGCMGKTTWQKFVSRHISLETSEGGCLSSVCPSLSRSWLWMNSYGMNVTAKQQKSNITDEGLAALLRIQGVTVKFTLEEATKAQRGSRGIALLFL